MKIEINGVQFDYLQEKNEWQKLIRESLGSDCLDIVAYENKPDMFFQILIENHYVSLQKRAEKYLLEQSLETLSYQQIIELLDLYFSSSQKFNSFYDWTRTDDGLSKDEQVEYKKYSWKTHEFLKYQMGGLAIFSFIPMYYFKFTYLMSSYRLISVAGLLASSIGLYKCFRWELLHKKRLKYYSFSEAKLIIAAIFCISFALIILLAPTISTNLTEPVRINDFYLDRKCDSGFSSST